MLSESGIYHVMARGINGQAIFKDNRDNQYYLQTLKELKQDGGFELNGYCIMNNHVHLLLREGSESLSQVMRRLGSSYVYWYNRKYERVGYLFQDRFKSEPVENDAYFLTVLRYIHQNPLKAGLCSNINEYKWSSYHDYLAGNGLTDINFALNIFGSDKEKALNRFIDFHNKENNDRCLEMDTIQRLSDEAAAKIIVREGKVNLPSELLYAEKAERDMCIKVLKNKYNLSIRQIERLTGINRNIIARA